MCGKIAQNSVFIYGECDENDLFVRVKLFINKSVPRGTIEIKIKY